MAWLDDRIWAHPKIRDVPRATRWEYAASVAYASGFHTEGMLTAGQLKAIECTPKDRELLIKVGLWEDASADGNDGAIRIHDWKDHNGKRDQKRRADRLRKRAARAKDAEMSAGQGADSPQDKVSENEGVSAGQASDGPRVRDRRRPPDDGVKSEGLQDTTAAVTPKNTTSTSAASSDEEPDFEHPETAAAVEAAATEQAILAACKRFGAEPNVAEPWARQLTGIELEAIVARMEMKIRRGTVDVVPGQFVDLMQRQVRENLKKAAAVTIRIPTSEETLHSDALAYAVGHHPWDVVADLLGRKMKKLDVPAERRDALLAVLHTAYDSRLAHAEPDLGDEEPDLEHAAV